MLSMPFMVKKEKGRGIKFRGKVRAVFGILRSTVVRSLSLLSPVQGPELRSPLENQRW